MSLEVLASDAAEICDCCGLVIAAGTPFILIDTCLGEESRPSMCPRCVAEARDLIDAASEAKRAAGRMARLADRVRQGNNPA
jgi:hypothetical protein